MVEREDLSGETEMIGVVDRNIAALLARKQADEMAKGLPERIADAITRFTGSMRFVYIHLVVFGLWITVNLGWLPVVPRFNLVSLCWRWSPRWRPSFCLHLF